MLNFGSGVLRDYRNTKFSLPIFFATQTGGAWYDLQDMSTLYQDTAKTTPVTATGQTIALVADKSGFGNDVQVSGAYTNIRTDIYGLAYTGWSTLKSTLDAAVPSVANYTGFHYTSGFATVAGSGHWLGSVYALSIIEQTTLDMVRDFMYHNVWTTDEPLYPGQLTPGLTYPYKEA